MRNLWCYSLFPQDKQGIPWWLGVSYKGIGQYDQQDKLKPRKVDGPLLINQPMAVFVVAFALCILCVVPKPQHSGLIFDQTVNRVNKASKCLHDCRWRRSGKVAGKKNECMRGGGNDLLA